MTQTGVDVGVPEEARLLSEWLTSGKPELGWRGDPRLFLHIGVVTAGKNGIAGDGKWYRKGDIVKLVFEVRRENEDGTETSLIVRTIPQWHEIIPALIEMDPRTPGFRPVMDRVIESNDAHEREEDYKAGQIRGEMMEHMWNVARTHMDGEHFFAMGDTRPKQR